MTGPFFSVLLPTRNRSEIVGEAISSILNQSFKDFELIISDNDESETATRAAIARFADPRIRYFRTNGHLPMFHNWENALNHATGKYMLVVEDKQRLVGNALEILHRQQESYPEIPISYQVKFARTATIPDPSLDQPGEIWNCTDLIEEFCRFSYKFFQRIPKSLDSCAPLALVRQIQKTSPTGMFFSYISPDYASGFSLLAASDRLLHLPIPLVYIPNNWMWKGRYSNGQDCYRKGQSVRNYITTIPISPEEILRDLPLKCQFLWINPVIHDFRTFYRRKNHQPEIDWVKYHAFAITLIIIGRKLGGDMSQEVAELRRSVRERGTLFGLRVGVDFLGRALGMGWLYLRSLVR